MAGVTPDKIHNIKRSVWNVLHISNNRTNFAISKVSAPSTYDQYFQCPRCCGTWNENHEDYCHGISAPMYIVTPAQEYYQPLNGDDTIFGRYVNENWSAYIEHPAKKKGEKRGKRSITEMNMEQQKRSKTEPVTTWKAKPSVGRTGDKIKITEGKNMNGTNLQWYV